MFYYSNNCISTRKQKYRLSTCQCYEIFFSIKTYVLGTVKILKYLENGGRLKVKLKILARLFSKARIKQCTTIEILYVIAIVHSFEIVIAINLYAEIFGALLVFANANFNMHFISKPCKVSWMIVSKRPSIYFLCILGLFSNVS